MCAVGFTLSTRCVSGALVGGLLALASAACGSSDDGAGPAESTTAVTSEQVEIRTSVRIAPTPGAEPIATGEILDGSSIGGTGAFEGLSGSGTMEVANDPDGDGPAHETFTGTVTR